MPKPMHEEILLRIFLAEDDYSGSKALYHVITERALSDGLSGATVLPGPTSFGRTRQIRNELNPDAGIRVPVIIEIVDVREKIEAFLPYLDGVIDSGLITMEAVKACRYGN